MMNHKLNKLIYILALFTALNLVFGRVEPAGASADNLFWGGHETNIQTTLGLGNKDTRTIVANVVNVALGFIGIIALMIIVMAGFKLMTTGGNEEALLQARKMLSSGVIGLIVVLASFGVAQFVVNNLYLVTGAVN